MKEVFVLYGRVQFCDVDPGDAEAYFQESPVLEVFDTYEAAYTHFVAYVKQAYGYFQETCPDADFGGEDPEKDVQWEFDRKAGYYAHWQMYGGGIPGRILPGLHLEKRRMDPELVDYTF